MFISPTIGNAANYVELEWAAEQLMTARLDFPISADITRRAYPGAPLRPVSIWTMPGVQAATL